MALPNVLGWIPQCDGAADSARPTAEQHDRKPGAQHGLLRDLHPWKASMTRPCPSPVSCFPGCLFPGHGAGAGNLRDPTIDAGRASKSLDWIEQKLDEVLRRLDQPRNQPLGALQVGSASPSPPTPAPAANGLPAASLEAYRPGGLVVARAAPRDPNGLSAIPADGVGGFVYTGGPIPLNDIGTRGVCYTGPVGVEFQGWLRAKEAGRYQLAVDVSAHLGSSYSGPTCFLQA